jgi:hypothetical protein
LDWLPLSVSFGIAIITNPAILVEDMAPAARVKGCVATKVVVRFVVILVFSVCIVVILAFIVNVAAYWGSWENYEGSCCLEQFLNAIVIPMIASVRVNVAIRTNHQRSHDALVVVASFAIGAFVVGRERQLKDTNYFVVLVDADDRINLQFFEM